MNPPSEPDPRAILPNALARDLETSEGIVEWLLLVLFALLAVLPHGLSWSQSGTFMTIVAGMKSTRRLAIKLFVLQKGLGIAGPVIPAALAGTVPILDRIDGTPTPASAPTPLDTPERADAAAQTASAATWAAGVVRDHVRLETARRPDPPRSDTNGNGSHYALEPRLGR